MKRILIGLAIAGSAAAFAPQASAVEYCDATFRPSCEQCLPEEAVNWTGMPICVWIGGLLPAAG